MSRKSPSTLQMLEVATPSAEGKKSLTEKLSQENLLDSALFVAACRMNMDHIAAGRQLPWWFHVVRSITAKRPEMTVPAHQTHYKLVFVAVAHKGGFWSYVAGVAYWMTLEHDVGGIQITIYENTLPMGRGLSSSAAICVLVRISHVSFAR
jgi:GHMP kinases N terminal domain